jgi:ubiquitin C-terminal hydrolase
MDDNNRYKLRGVIIHQGFSETGHYFSIIKLNGKWYEFNDKSISEMTEAQVIAYSFGDQESKGGGRNAYMVIYEKAQQSSLETASMADWK